MNTCCCRSHNDRTDPMACLPAFPRLEQMPPCRPQLESGKSSPCLSGARRWGQINSVMVELVAKMVDKPAMMVCQFLHQLTLQLFSRILYPLMAGWNTLKVPFVMSDTCELYYGIFDENGDLRKPMPTKTFLILITMLQYFLNLPTLHSKGCKRKSKCPGCSDMQNNIRNIHNPGYCGKNAMCPFSGRRQQKSEPDPGKEIYAGLKRVGYEQTFALDSYPSVDDLTYGYAPFRCPCQNSNGPSPPKKDVVNPYASMVEPYKSMAVHSACERALRSSMLAPTVQRSPVVYSSPKLAQRFLISHLSDLYSAVVQNKHSRQLFGDLNRSLPISRPLITPCTQTNRRFSGGLVMPQLYFSPQRRLEQPGRSKPFELHRNGRQLLDEDNFRYRSTQEEMHPNRNNSLLPFGNVSQDNRFKNYAIPENLSWKGTLQGLGNLLKEKQLQALSFPKNVAKNQKLLWEDQMLMGVNRVKKPMEDYWREMMKREEMRRALQPWSQQPVKEQRIYTTPRKESYFAPPRSETPKKIVPKNQSKERNPSKSRVLRRKSGGDNAVYQKSPNNPTYNHKNQQFESRTLQRKNVADRSVYQPIYNPRNQQLEKTKVKPTNSRYTERKPECPCRSMDCFLRRNAGGAIEHYNYPDPEEYRREIFRKHSRTRRLKSKIAGESVLLLKPAESIRRKRSIIKPLVEQDMSYLTKPFTSQDTCDTSKKTVVKKVRFQDCVQKAKSVEFMSPILAEDKLKTKLIIRRNASLEGAKRKPIVNYKPEGGDQLKLINKPNLSLKLQNHILTLREKQLQPLLPERIIRKVRYHFEPLNIEMPKRQTKSPERTSKRIRLQSPDFGQPKMDIKKAKTKSTLDPERGLRNKKTYIDSRRETTVYELPKKRAKLRRKSMGNVSEM